MQPPQYAQFTTQREVEEFQQQQAAAAQQHAQQQVSHSGATKQGGSINRQYNNKVQAHEQVATGIVVLYGGDDNREKSSIRRHKCKFEIEWSSQSGRYINASKLKVKWSSMLGRPVQK